MCRLSEGIEAMKAIEVQIGESNLMTFIDQGSWLMANSMTER